MGGVEGGEARLEHCSSVSQLVEDVGLRHDARHRVLRLDHRLLADALEHLGVAQDVLLRLQNTLL